MFEKKQKHLKQKISLKKRMWLGLFGVLVFLLPLHTTYAIIHEIIVGEPTSEGICSDDTPFGDLVGDLVGSLALDALANVIGGVLSVPVSDSITHFYLKRIRSDLAATAGNTAVTAGNTAIIQSCLEMLVLKETITDVELQHQWRNIIGTFVQDTVKWVQTAYNGNPAFVNSQYVYYRAVTDNVFLTYLQEVARSDVGDIAKRSALIGLLSRNFANVFPYITTDGSVLAPDGVAESLSSAAGFVGNGGLAAQIELQSSGGNSLDFGKIAVAEFDRRLKEQKEYENEKLAWGRGFFSYEICDLDIFGLYDDAGNWLAADPNDRRNCRIVTPGSLIQDQVSFVLGSALRQMELADEVDEWVSGNAGLVLRNVLGEYGLDPASYYINTLTTNNFYKPETVGAVDPIIFSEIYASNEERAGEIIGGLRDFLETDTDDDGVANGTLYPREFSQRDIELDAVNASETGVFTATLFTTEEARRILESSGIEDVGGIIPDLGGP